MTENGIFYMIELNGEMLNILGKKDFSRYDFYDRESKVLCCDMLYEP